MAKIVIEIEDLPDGTVRLTGTPDAAVMALMAESPDDCTAAEGYALGAWNALLDMAQAARKAARPH
jgi:hypothetical protein